MGKNIFAIQDRDGSYDVFQHTSTLAGTHTMPIGNVKTRPACKIYFHPFYLACETEFAAIKI